MGTDISSTGTTTLTAAWSPAARRTAGVLGFALLAALGARVSVPLPGTPVPFTFQVVAVLLAGYLAGPATGAASQAAYLAAGAAGLPVFAAGGGAAYLLGPTGGYLLAYPAAAAVAGWVATREGAGPGVHALGLVAAVAVIYAGGAGWLAAVSGPEAALQAGVVPFVVVDLLKVLFVLLLGWRIGPAARRFFA